MLKFNYKGEQVEVEETEVLQAVKDEYDHKLAELEEKNKQQLEEQEKALKNLREEHAKQIRVILSTGKVAEETKETAEKDEIQQSINRIIRSMQR